MMPHLILVRLDVMGKRNQPLFEFAEHREKIIFINGSVRKSSIRNKMYLPSNRIVELYNAGSVVEMGIFSTRLELVTSCSSCFFPKARTV